MLLHVCPNQLELTTAQHQSSYASEVVDILALYKLDYYYDYYYDDDDEMTITIITITVAVATITYYYYYYYPAKLFYNFK